MHNMHNIKEYRLKLFSLYSSLDIFLEANPEILITLDNPDNFYSYSDKLRLFDTLQMLENKYSNLSLIDLKIRCLHYSIAQYQLIDKFINYMTCSLGEEGNTISITSEIKVTLCCMIQFLILPEDLPSIPQYLLNPMIEYKLYKVEG